MLELSLGAAGVEVGSKQVVSNRGAVCQTSVGILSRLELLLVLANADLRHVVHVATS